MDTLIKLSDIIERMRTPQKVFLTCLRRVERMGCVCARKYCVVICIKITFAFIPDKSSRTRLPTQESEQSEHGFNVSVVLYTLLEVIHYGN